MFLNSIRGSSPLARGTRFISSMVHHVAGLIPARAGNTAARAELSRSFLARAHPRSRGEHRFCSWNKGYDWGSSPLARGTLWMLERAGFTIGLIPARAGNTTTPLGLGSSARAHPRSRGEHTVKTKKKEVRAGSSPLARGTHFWVYFEVCSKGLIPARAGNTQSEISASTFSRAHPRSRGEHMSSSLSSVARPGSSPLARGTLFDGLKGAIENGLIPARAGNT